MFDRIFRSDAPEWDIAGDAVAEFETRAPLPGRSEISAEAGHRAVWKRVTEGGHSTALIVAPHATVHPAIVALLDPYLKCVPTDWDVLCLGSYYPTPPAHVAGHAFRPSSFSIIHGYAVRDRVANRLLELSKPAEALEQTLARLQAGGSLNVYALWPNLLCPRGSANAPHDFFNSFRQLGQHGRLGNQFFQVAATIGAAVRHGYRPQFPAWKNSTILHESFDQALDPARIAGFYDEPHFHYAPIPDAPNLDLTGFFQSPRYFGGYENLIRQYLRPSDKLRDAVTTRFATLLAKPTVALHVRRADYVGLSHSFQLLPVEYYRAAMKRFGPGHHFAVFSDDPAWCRTAFASDDVEIIEGNPGYADLYIMARCKHQVIANSSFSWWAAWLNENPDKRVITPAKWFGPSMSANDTRDLLPSDWVVLDA